MAIFWRPSLLLLVVFTVFVTVFVHAQDDEMDDQIEEGEPPGFEDEGTEDFGDDALSEDQLKGIHSKFDLNKDGKASMAEIFEFAQGIRKDIAKKDVASILEEIDTDQDGKLSLSELLADTVDEESSEEELKEKRDEEQKKFELLDLDKDGMLDQNEVPALFYPETHEGVLDITAASVLKQKDLDKNGKLTPQELWEVEKGASLTEEESEHFTKLDKNGDGELELSEFKEWERGTFHLEQTFGWLFGVADKDKDGHLSAEELANQRDVIASSDAQWQLTEWVEHQMDHSDL